MSAVVEGPAGALPLGKLDKLAKKYGGHNTGSGVFLPTMTRDASYDFRTSEGARKFVSEAKKMDGVELAEVG